MSSFKNISILSLVLALSVAGCASKAQQPTQSIDDVQKSMGLVPCDTDSDCLEKNGDLENESKVAYICDAFTKKGERCKRHVKEDGLMCWQHSKEFNNPTTREAFLARQPKEVK